MANNFIDSSYSDMLGINPKYEAIINTSLTEKGIVAYKAIVNKCAHSILHYDEIRARGFAGGYSFGVSRHRDDKLLHPMSFDTNTIEYHCGVKVAGATMSKLVRLGLLKITSKGHTTQYALPDDFFTTNDLSIGLYQPVNTSF